MKGIFLTLAIALTSLAGKAQIQLDIDNQTGTNWNAEIYLDIPGHPNAFRSGTRSLFPNGNTYYTSNVLTWIDQSGNSIPFTSLPSNVEWGMIRIWNPCGISGNASFDILSLNTGITFPARRKWYDNAGVTQNCPLVSSPLFDAAIFLPGAPGHVNLQIH